MEIYINDNQKIVPQGTTLKELIDELSMCTKDHYAVAVNNLIITKQQWEYKILEKNDDITIIHPAQGG